MKPIKLTIIERKNGSYFIKTNNAEFELLRTGNGEEEFLEPFPYNFPFRPIRFKLNTKLSLDVLETLVAKELAEYTRNFVNL